MRGNKKNAKREKGIYKKKNFRRRLMNLRSNYTEQIFESNPYNDDNFLVMIYA